MFVMGDTKNMLDSSISRNAYQKTLSYSLLGYIHILKSMSADLPPPQEKLALGTSS